MTIGTVLLILLIIAVIVALPTWPYSAAWGPGPSSVAGVVLILVILAMLLGWV